MHRDFTVAPFCFSLLGPPLSPSYPYGMQTSPQHLPAWNEHPRITDWMKCPNVFMCYTKSFLFSISTDIWGSSCRTYHEPYLRWTKKQNSPTPITLTPNTVFFRLTIRTADNVTFYSHKHLGCSQREPVPIWRLPRIPLTHSRQKWF